MSSTLRHGKITPEGVQAVRDKIGVPLRARNAFNTTSSFDPVKHWCEGIGDDNPLWYDLEHGASSSLGMNVAPPSYLYSVCTSWIQLGLPGVHGFHSGSDWHWVRPIPHNEPIDFTIWIDDVEEKPSQTAGKSVIIYYSTIYYDKDENVLGRVRSYSFRQERSAERGASKKAALELAKWTEKDFEEIEAKYLGEKVRGSEPRFWEDVQVGDELDPVHKGPLCLSDMIAFYAGAMVVPGPAHGLAVKDRQKHPFWWFRNPDNGGLEPPVRVHESEQVAIAAGLPAPYDIGVQRNAWLIHLLTNWAGDDGFIVSADAQYRAFNFFGDFTTFGGKVERKYEQDGEHLVDVTLWGISQRGQNSIPGNATIALPSREKGTKPAVERTGRLIKLSDYVKDLPVTPPQL